MNVRLEFGSSSNKFKSRKNKLLNTVRFKCFLSFKARGEGGREEEEEREGKRKKRREYEGRRGGEEEE